MAKTAPFNPFNEPAGSVPDRMCGTWSRRSGGSHHREAAKCL